VDKESRNS
jgi:hypothetical protein